MSTVMGKRLSRLEASSAWGGKTELASASLVFMRVPEGGESDSRVIASRMDYERRGQGFCVTSSPAASGLPMWTPVPIDRVAIELIDAAIEALQAKASASGVIFPKFEKPSDIDGCIQLLKADLEAEARFQVAQTATPESRVAVS